MGTSSFFLSKLLNLLDMAFLSPGSLFSIEPYHVVPLFKLGPQLFFPFIIIMVALLAELFSSCRMPSLGPLVVELVVHG